MHNLKLVLSESRVNHLFLHVAFILPMQRKQHTSAFIYADRRIQLPVSKWITNTTFTTTT